MTSLLQPLEVSINKCEGRAKWNQWIAEGHKSITPTGHIRRPDLALVCTWVLEAWQSIPETMVAETHMMAVKTTFYMKI